MGFDPNLDTEVYHKLTQSPKPVQESNKNWTFYLILCCLTVTTASFSFGYNISALNSPTQILKNFTLNHIFLFNEYYEKKALFELNEGWLIGNETKLNSSFEEYELAKSEYITALLTFDFEKREKLEIKRQQREEEVRSKYNLSIEEFFVAARKKLNGKKEELEGYRVKLSDGTKKVNKVTEILWTVLNCLFVIGGMIGAFTSKFVLDLLGRKKGILFHNLFSLTGSILVVVSFFSKSPVCLLISRFLFGIQGGMSCSLIPTYLSEISPSALRGQTGVVHQLCLTIGILVAQILGFRQILGTGEYWYILLSFPIVPCLIGSFCLLIFFPETPKALLIKNKDANAAEKALKMLRYRANVKSDMDLIYEELNSSSDSNENISLFNLFKLKELRWPLITSLILQLAQQLCGINAIFFYSNGIFKNAGIPDDMIQYAVFSTGLVNVISTIICVPLIDRLGRKPLLVYPMMVIIFDFILLTVFLLLQSNEEIYISFLDQIIKGKIFSYLSIACIIVFIICFAIGLGPIPFIYVAESFRQNARGAALAVCMFTNWMANLILTLSFEHLANLLTNFVFIIFTVIVLVSLVVIIIKVPETKGKNVEEIIDKLNGKDLRYQKNEYIMTEQKA